ncbi:glyoxalase [Aliidiomarina taiwanensis]|uniref:Glyoxalase n=1 Tax=Aliidiomarina taiwanensis TaxID=946228 RepID=A0A432X956_9GAMM|nr:VOC family protein [Aliidiomarina taiwanensis]RUO43932.1 glyoxalase [Aliidiomarina taiwanensis]
MKIGCFSVSLAVKDLAVSQAFYKKLGFEVYAGNPEHHFVIMKNGDTNIGLFQGMFEDNILTFNPGWDQGANPLSDFDDIRALHQTFKAQGMKTVQENLQGDAGPGSFAVLDPDGNAILFDQHV